MLAVRRSLCRIEAGRRLAQGRVATQPAGRPAIQQCVRQLQSATRTLCSAQQGASTVNPRPAEAPPSWDIRMLYDGDCPLCMREVNMLRRRDAGKGKIDFVDIASPAYDPADNAGISYEQAMGTIHAVLPSGNVVTNVEVFRRLYEAVGLGWVYAATKWKPVLAALNWVYGFWAKNRLAITGRSDLDVIMREKKSCRVES